MATFSKVVLKKMLQIRIPIKWSFYNEHTIWLPTTQSPLAQNKVNLWTFKFIYHVYPSICKKKIQIYKRTLPYKQTKPSIHHSNQPIPVGVILDQARCGASARDPRRHLSPDPLDPAREVSSSAPTSLLPEGSGRLHVSVHCVSIQNILEIDGDLECSPFGKITSRTQVTLT